MEYYLVHSPVGISAAAESSESPNMERRNGASLKIQADAPAGKQCNEKDRGCQFRSASQRLNRPVLGILDGHSRLGLFNLIARSDGDQPSSHLINDPSRLI